MTQNPVRSESEMARGEVGRGLATMESGWGAPLRAELAPREGRQGHQGPVGRLLDGVIARGPAAPVGTPAVTQLRARPQLTELRRPGRTAGRERRDARREPAPGVRTVKHVDLKSVAKVSAIFYAIVLVVMVVASIFVWVVADSVGAVHSIDHSVQSLFGVKKYVLHPATIALYTAGAGAVVAVTGTLVNVLAAGVYNVIADVVGGVKVRVEDPT